VSRSVFSAKPHAGLSRGCLKRDFWWFYLYLFLFRLTQAAPFIVWQLSLHTGPADPVFSFFFNSLALIDQSFCANPSAASQPPSLPMVRSFPCGKPSPVRGLLFMPWPPEGRSFLLFLSRRPLPTPHGPHVDLWIVGPQYVCEGAVPPRLLKRLKFPFAFPSLEIPILCWCLLLPNGSVTSLPLPHMPALHKFQFILFRGWAGPRNQRVSVVVFNPPTLTGGPVLPSSF